MSTALLIAPSSVVGGSQRVFAAVAAQLPTHGMDVQVVLLEPGPLESWLADVGCAFEVIAAGRFRDGPRTVDTLRRLTRRASGVDIVLSNESKGHVYGGLAAARAGKPAIWWQHGNPSTGPIDRLAARIPARAIICCSNGVADAQRRLSRHREVVVIPGGVPVDAVAARAGSGRALRTRSGWDHTQLVGIVGRLQEWKGQEQFLRAAAQVADRLPSTRFLVVGGPPPTDEGAAYEQRLHRLASELTIGPATTFVGEQADVYPWLDALDVVVVASEAEPFGLVLVEALALGTPVVATAEGGPTEIIEDGVSGVLVPPDDASALAGAIVDLLVDEERTSALAAGARQRADSFAEARMVERVAALLDATIGEGDQKTDSGNLQERTVPGLHGHLMADVLPRLGIRGTRALDLGAGSGAFAQQLAAVGFDVLACDLEAGQFRGGGAFHQLDLDTPDFAGGLGTSSFDLITAIEIIEHLESPIAFLRNVERLLAPAGIAIVTTPNVDSLAARLKFLTRDKLRLLDEAGDPTHISPVFWDLLVRQYLPRVGLDLISASTYPPRGHAVGRAAYRRVLNAVGSIGAHNPRLVGDNHVLVLVRAGA